MRCRIAMVAKVMPSSCSLSNTKTKRRLRARWLQSLEVAIKLFFLSVFVFFLEINYLVICAFICCNAKKIKIKKIVRAEHGLDAAPAPKTRTSGENILRNVVLLLHTIQSTRQPISCQCVGATSSDASGGASTRTRRSTSRTRKDNAIVWKRSKSLNSVVAFE